MRERETGVRYVRTYVFDMHKYLMCLCERWLIDESGPLVQLVTDIRTDILKLLL